MIAGYIDILKEGLSAPYLDKRYGMVQPHGRIEEGGQKKIVPVTHHSGELVSPDGTKSTVLWFENPGGQFSVTDHKEYIEFTTDVQAVLWMNRALIDKDNPNVDDIVMRDFASKIRDYKINEQGYKTQRVALKSLNNNPQTVFAKYTLSDLVNFTIHPYAVCSVVFSLTFTYCPSDIQINPRC